MSIKYKGELLKLLSYQGETFNKLVYNGELFKLITEVNLSWFSDTFTAEDGGDLLYDFRFFIEKYYTVNTFDGLGEYDLTDYNIVIDEVIVNTDADDQGWLRYSTTYEDLIINLDESNSATAEVSTYDAPLLGKGALEVTFTVDGNTLKVTSTDHIYSYRGFTTNLLAVLFRLVPK